MPRYRLRDENTPHVHTRRHLDARAPARIIFNTPWRVAFESASASTVRRAPPTRRTAARPIRLRGVVARLYLFLIIIARTDFRFRTLVPAEGRAKYIGLPSVPHLKFDDLYDKPSYSIVYAKNDYEPAIILRKFER